MQNVTNSKVFLSIINSEIYCANIQQICGCAKEKDKKVMVFLSA